MMEPDLPGMGAVMDIEESGLDFMVTGPRILPEPERARVFGSVMVKAGLYVCMYTGTGGCRIRRLPLFVPKRHELVTGKHR
jgi:hypothetical protein